MNSKILTLLGFVSKAGKLSYGMNATLTALKGGKAQVVIAAMDTSAKSKKELIFHAEKYGVKNIVLESVSAEQLSHAVGRRCSIISVNEQGFAEAIIKGN